MKNKTLTFSTCSISYPGESWHKSVPALMSSHSVLNHARRGFKALKQLVKVYFKNKMYDKMMESYRCVCILDLQSL